MRITKRENCNCLIFDIEGNITFDTSQNVEQYIYKHLSSKYNKIVINLKNVSHLNSAALCSFYRFFRTLKEQEISLYIMNTNEQVHNMFTITGVEKYFTFIKNFESLTSNVTS